MKGEGGQCIGHNLRREDSSQALRCALGFLPPLWGKVRKRGIEGAGTADGPLILSLSHEGRGDPWPEVWEKWLKLRLMHADRCCCSDTPVVVGSAHPTAYGLDVELGNAHSDETVPEEDLNQRSTAAEASC